MSSTRSDDAYDAVRDYRVIDIVDDEWARDVLPDDDVQLGPGMVPPADDADDANENADETSDENTWKDLGLHSNA